MRKLYLLVGLLALVPITYAAGCGNSDTGSGGGNSSGTAGGQVQNFVFEIDVDWTIRQQKVTPASCGGTGAEDQVLVRLSGTEDPSDHKEKTVSCTDGPVKFTNLTRLQAGAMLDVEAFIQNPAGMTILSAFQTVTPASGVVAVHLDFSPPNPVTSTTAGPGPGPGGNGGMGGMGGAGGAGGAGQSSSSTAASTSSSHSSTAASTAASTGSG